LASLGELERTVMERLWSADGPVTAAELRDGLADRGLALTTVHTVLSRLEQKGFVEHDESRPRRFLARGTREEHAAELMHEVLGQAADRQAVLARFVGSVSGDEARLLRALLDAADADAGVAVVGPDDGDTRA
jgi:predicted transcriptional regulator